MGDGIAYKRRRRAAGGFKALAGAREIDADENAAEVEDHDRARRWFRFDRLRSGHQPK
jgi:hypothetical protein